MRVNISYLFVFILSIFIIHKSEASIEAEIEKINSQAPIMIDSETRLDRASVSGKSVAFYYTILSMEHSEYDFQRLRNEFLPNQVNSICQIYSPMDYYQKGFSVTYKYFDKNSVHLIDVVTDEAVCGS